MKNKILKFAGLFSIFISAVSIMSTDNADAAKAKATTTPPAPEITTSTSYGSCNSDSAYEKDKYPSTSKWSTPQYTKTVKTYSDGVLTKTEYSDHNCSKYNESEQGSGAAGVKTMTKYYENPKGSGRSSVTLTAYFPSSVSVYYSNTSIRSIDSPPNLRCTIYYNGPYGNESCSPAVNTNGRVGDTQQYCASYTTQFGKSDSHCYTKYWPTSVSISVSKSSSRVDSALPTFSCTITYGSAGTSSCTSNMTKTVSTVNGSTKTCYKYTVNSKSDETCTTRHNVKKIEIEGADKSYTGMKNVYKCLVTFTDGSVKDVSNESGVISSSTGMLSGEQNGYNINISVPNIEHRNETVPAYLNVSDSSAKNVLYNKSASDNSSQKIKCNYSSYKTSSQISDSSTTNTVNTSKTVRHYGIQKLEIRVSGSFPQKGKSYGDYEHKTELVSKGQNAYFEKDFLTGSYYNFDAFVLYTDGTDGNNGSNFRKIELIEKGKYSEMIWTQDTTYAKQYDKNTRFTKSGIGHRIAKDGTNNISVDYFGKKAYIKIWARQPVSVKIYQTKNNALLNDNLSNIEEPTKNVKAQSSRKYYAIVTFSDEGNNPFGSPGKEDWSKFVTWKSDYVYKYNPDSEKNNISEIGTMTFPRGDKEKVTLYVVYEDIDTYFDEAGLGVNILNDYQAKYRPNESDWQWDKHSDQVEFIISDDCVGIEYLTFGCPMPEDLWNIQGFENGMKNFLPPASYYGFTEWNPENNPYQYYFKFQVTGVSDGTGNGSN